MQIKNDGITVNRTRRNAGALMSTVFSLDKLLDHPLALAPG
jgi:hypothetical protein